MIRRLSLKIGPFPYIGNPAFDVRIERTPKGLKTSLRRKTMSNCTVSVVVAVRL
jgi:hypothetical protein